MKRIAGTHGCTCSHKYKESADEGKRAGGKGRGGCTPRQSRKAGRLKVREKYKKPKVGCRREQ